MALTAIALLSACSGNGSPAPKNWRPIAGAKNAWSNGSGSTAQEYRYDTAPFSGTLSDLASQVTIDILTRYRGAKLQSSNPFVECPGAAAVATFRLADRELLQEGFAVRNGQAIRVRYIRPSQTAVDPSVPAALQNVLCVPPA